MTIVTKPNTFVANELIDANQMNQNFDSIYGSVNGSLDASNMSVNGLNDLTKFANEVVTQLKTKGLIYTQDLFSQSFFVSGGLATFPGSPLNQISVTTATAYIIQADGSYRRVVLTGTTYTTATLSATYYLDLQPDGTISWGTAHSGQTGYLSLATVTTNGSGNVNVVTDVRVLFAGMSWQNISKVGSSLADLATRLASDLTGTLAAAQLPAHTGEATSSAGSAALTLLNSAVIAKLITGYVKGAGIVASTDSILAAIQKLAGNSQRPSTLTVAASNSSAAGIAAADYVCTGAGDQTTINTAIAALPVITVESGTAQAGASSTVTLASVANAVDNFYTGYTIVITGGTGSGQSKAIAGYVGATKVATVASAWTTNPSATSTYNITSPCGKVILLEGLFSIAAAVTVPNNVTLEGQGNGTLLKIPNSNNSTMNVIQNADQTNGNSGISISKLKIDGNKGNNTGSQNGITLTKTYYSNVQNVTVFNTTVTGLNVSSSNNNSVTGNYFQGNSYALAVSSSNNNTVSGNSCQGNGTMAILVNSSSNNNTVTGNTCQGNPTLGISLVNTTNNTVAGNTCQGNNYGIGVNSSNNNTVTGNTCQGNSTNGILVTTSSSNNTVSGNTCQGNGNAGLSISSSNNNTFTGNTCQGNTTSGINISSSNNNTVSGNTCQLNGQNGIAVVTSLNNTVCSNTCLENSQTTSVTYDNIFIDSTSNTNNVQSNTCRTGGQTNKVRYGIRVNTSNCTGNLVANNDLTTGGTTGAYSDLGTSTITTGVGNKLA